jgi:hypothetical protein
MVPEGHKNRRDDLLRLTCTPGEFDPDQPRLKASLQARFRHYRDLDRTEPRLRALMGEFAFTSVREILAV